VQHLFLSRKERRSGLVALVNQVLQKVLVARARGKIATASHEQRLIHRLFEAVMRLFDIAILMGHPCAGSLAYLFSNSPFRRNEQHEQHAVLFHARHHNPQPLFAEVPSFQEHGAAQSAMLKRGSHLLGFSALASDGVEEKKCFSVLFHLQ